MTVVLRAEDLLARTPDALRVQQQLSGLDDALVLTGAGCSADSGLPLFTGPGGLYADAAVAAASDAASLPGSLPQLWRVWGPMRARIRAAPPHNGHAAVAAWIRRREERGLRTTLATQNVDDLHERAGTPDVQHLHGQLDVTSCLDCSFRRSGDTTPYETVPSCPRCSGPLRPGIVLFGEPPDLDASSAARRAVRQCRVYLAVGTSGVVSTSTGLLRYAGDVGAVRIAVDPGREVDTRYDVHVRDTAATALPLLLAP